MSSVRKTINAEGAPEAIGPYSHAVSSNGTLYCSGQIPLDPDSGEVVVGGPRGQTTQCLRNLETVCEAAGHRLQNAIRMTVYTTVLEHFEEINDAYAGFFGQDPPARVTVGVAALPRGALVEIDAIVAP